MIKQSLSCGSAVYLKEKIGTQEKKKKKKTINNKLNCLHDFRKWSCNGSPFQYSCLGNPMDRGVARVRQDLVTKQQQQ